MGFMYLLALIIAFSVAQQVPMSPCTVGRHTIYQKQSKSRRMRAMAPLSAQWDQATSTLQQSTITTIPQEDSVINFQTNVESVIK